MSTRPRAFNIPEILSLICGFSEISDCARVSRVCRAGFYAATPFIWEHVVGAHNLLALLPGIKITEGPSGSFQIRPGRSPFANTTRFSIYSPYVKSLDVFSNKIERYHLGEWDRLLAYASQHTLLPNLVTLSLQSNYRNHHPVISQFGILFASASLQEILFTSQSFEKPPETPQSTVKALVKQLVKKSPQLRRLSIFAESDDVYVEEDGPLEFLSLASGQPPAYITEIRDLCCNLLFLAGEGMQVLGKLSHLESLTIHSQIYDANYSLVTTLPDDSFPGLKCLNLCSSLEEDFITVFKIRPMFSRITTLSICPQKYAFDFPNHEWIVHNIFPFLVNTPCLQNLTIRFDLFRPEIQSQNWTPLSTVPNSMLHLPLKSLTINQPMLDFNKLSGFGSTWAQVAYLELPRNYASTSMLTAFCQLPSLEHLVITLNLNLARIDENPPQKANPMPFHTLEASIHSWKYVKAVSAQDCPFLHGPVIKTCPAAHKVDDLDKIASFLLLFWPELRRVIWPKRNKSQTPRYIRLLNQRLQSLRPRDGGVAEYK
ncbi:hypothetical protein BDV93DRAFT_526275 [Ceratobasidium sp. AG-I]|nr:hypothetical protein BDV93DRAFT_526275 [Ceratobasidium sp. AG-I]